jgi:DNA-binding protein YbaB
MFDKLKTMQALGALMKNRDQIAQASERVKLRLEALRVEGQSGSGACRATVSGAMRVIDITLDPALLAGMSVDETTRDLAQGLIVDAVNDAMKNAQARAKEIIAKEMEDLGLGDLDLGSGELSGLLG